MSDIRDVLIERIHGPKADKIATILSRLEGLVDKLSRDVSSVRGESPSIHRAFGDFRRAFDKFFDVATDELEESVNEAKKGCSNCGKPAGKDAKGDVCRKCNNEINRPPSIPSSSKDEGLNFNLDVDEADGSVKKSLDKIIAAHKELQFLVRRASSQKKLHNSTEAKRALDHLNTSVSKIEQYILWELNEGTIMEPGFVKTPEDEKLWKKAKAKAGEEGGEPKYALANHIFQNMKKAESIEEAGASTAWIQAMRSSLGSVVKNPTVKKAMKTGFMQGYGNKKKSPFTPGSSEDKGYKLAQQTTGIKTEGAGDNFGALRAQDTSETWVEAFKADLKEAKPALDEAGLPNGEYWKSTKGKKGREKGKTPWGADAGKKSKDPVSDDGSEAAKKAAELRRLHNERKKLKRKRKKVKETWQESFRVDLEESYPELVKQLRRVSFGRKNVRVGGMNISPDTAALVVTTFDKLNPSNQRVMSKMNIAGMVDLATKMARKFGGK